MYRIRHPYLEGDCMEFESHGDALEWIHEEEIVYNSEAMEYLSENDYSLQESLDMAAELGYSVEYLAKWGAPLLATIHLQDSLAQAIEEVEDA